MTAQCSPFDQAARSHPALDDGDDNSQARLLDIYNAQARRTHSLNAVALVQATRGPKFGPRAGKSREITGFIKYEGPTWLRITGVVPPLGRKVFDLGSDGHEFHLLAPDHDTMKFFVGAIDAQPGVSEINVSDISEIARPREFLDALRWQEGTQRKTQASANVQKDSLEFDLPPRAGQSIAGKLQIDPRTGVVTSLKLYSADGEMVSELDYADWQLISNAVGGASQACFPHRVRLVRPVEDLQVDIRFLELTLNPRFPRSSFSLSPPPGIPVVRLNPAGKER